MKTTIISMMFMLLAVSFGQVVLKKSNQSFLIPKLLNYQGYLTDDQGNPINNPSLSMTFSIYDASSVGNLKWTEDQNVKVEKGIFNVTLGTVAPIPDTVFTGGIDRWLELIAGGQTLTPRTRLTAMGYAYAATYSDTAEYARSGTSDADWIISGDDMYSGVLGNVGIGTENPRGKLDVNGGLVLRMTTYNVSSGLNNMNVGPHSFVRIDGATANFDITGIAGGVDGRMLILYNNSTFRMRFKNENASSQPTNRIITAELGDTDIQDRGGTILMYDGAVQRWRIIQFRRN